MFSLPMDSRENEFDCSAWSTMTIHIKSWIILLFMIIFTSIPLKTVAEDREVLVKEVEASGEAIIEQLTPEEARQMALRKARSKGIEKALGVEVASHTLVRDFTLMADFIQTLSRGYILEEKVVRWDQLSYQEAPDKPPLTTYKVTLQMKIVPVQGKRDPYFKLRVTLNKGLFLEGEEAIIKITPTKDCYLTILNLTSKDQFNLLFPNAHQKNNFIKGGTKFIFPGSTFSLSMAPYPGHKRDVEAFVIIGAKEPINLKMLLGKEQDISLSDLYHVLLDIPMYEWKEKILPYEVRKR